LISETPQNVYGQTQATVTDNNIVSDLSWASSSLDCNLKPTTSNVMMISASIPDNNNNNTTPTCPICHTPILQKRAKDRFKSFTYNQLGSLLHTTLKLSKIGTSYVPSSWDKEENGTRQGTETDVVTFSPPGNSTGTLPPGSIIKVPPGTIGSATNPPPTNNNTGNPIAMTSSDNPPGCSKKIPIPPNCTLNPFNNSASN
jgi:hypothetical protein